MHSAAPSCLGAFQFGVAAGRDDRLGACNGGKLQREDRYAAGAEHQNGVARLHAALGHQALPSGHRGTRQRGGFFVRQIVGHVYQAVLVKHHLFRQHAVDGAAQG